MPQSQRPIEVYLEIGSKRTFAGAIDWPGWCRHGRDQDSALEALCAWGPRYARMLKAAKIEFKPPEDVKQFDLVERANGNTTTDFGAPDAALPSDDRPIDAAELRRLQAVLKACWQAFDDALEAAAGVELRKGPRGGGRELDAIAGHVLGAEAGYLSRLAWKYKPSAEASQSEQFRDLREAVLQALSVAAKGELPERGPRGGQIWTPRRFLRRAAWHVVDHVWEIEDRMQPEPSKHTRHKRGD